MKTVILTPLTPEHKDNIAPGYKLLPRRLAEIVDILRMYKNNDIRTDSIIERIAKFDTTYMYSDSGSVFTTWNKEENEILAEIKASTEFTEDEKYALRCGLNHNTVDVFNSQFPYSRVVYYYRNPPESMVDILNGDYDEKRIMRIAAQVNTLWESFNSIPKDSYRSNVVYTLAAPEAKLLTNKLSIRGRFQQDVLNFESKITSEELEYYIKWSRELYFNGTIVDADGDSKVVPMTGIVSKVRVSHSNPITLTDGSVVIAYYFNVYTSGGIGKMNLFIN